MADIKLTYFDFYGLGELTRLQYAFAGKHLEERRVKMEDWPKVKPTIKPFHQMPIMEMDGKIYPQSVAINNYVAKQTGLYPKSDMDQLTTDIVHATLHDLVKIQVKWLYLPDSDEKKKLEEEAPKEAEKFLVYLDTLLAQSKSGYFVGDSITMADLAMLDMITGYPRHSMKYSAEMYPHIAKNNALVMENANIKAYMEKRPKTFM